MSDESIEGLILLVPIAILLAIYVAVELYERM